MEIQPDISVDIQDESESILFPKAEPRQSLISAIAQSRINDARTKFYSAQMASMSVEKLYQSDYKYKPGLTYPSVPSFLR